MSRFDGLLRSDAWQHPVEELKVGRYNIPATSAVAASATGIMAAKKRVKTTAWVAASCAVAAVSAPTDTLTVTAVSMQGALANALKIHLKTSSDDVLTVTAATDTITINLAKTTAGNNTAAKIQVKIRALGTVNGLDVSAYTCAAGGDWDTAAKATGEEAAKAFSGGVTGDYDVITTGITNPAVPRNLTATTDGTAGDIANVALTIYGTDFNDEAISETLPYFTVNTKGTVTGAKAFKTITSIWLPAHDGADATTSIGFGSLIGLPIMLSKKLVTVAFDGVWEASAPTIALSETSLANNTIQIAGSLDGLKEVDILMYV